MLNIEWEPHTWRRQRRRKRTLKKLHKLWREYTAQAHTLSWTCTHRSTPQKYTNNQTHVHPNGKSSHGKKQRTEHAIYLSLFFPAFVFTQLCFSRFFCAFETAICTWTFFPSEQQERKGGVRGGGRSHQQTMLRQQRWERVYNCTYTCGSKTHTQKINKANARTKRL